MNTLNLLDSEGQVIEIICFTDVDDLCSKLASRSLKQEFDVMRAMLTDGEFMHSMGVRFSNETEEEFSNEE